MTSTTDAINYQRIEKAIQYLVAHYSQQPTLAEVAAQVGMSPYHFQRTFTQWAGVSPKQFAEFLTSEALKEEIRRTRSVLEASENVGLSAQSRAYDLMIKTQAMTPGEYKKEGHSLTISYGQAPSPFGDVLIANTQRGICALEFVDGDFERVLAEIQERWQLATWQRSDADAETLALQIFGEREAPLQLLLKGSPFQIQVWRALLSLPSGNIASYSEVATMVQKQSAVRAVASCVAKNPIGYIIPCHRVIRREGIIGQYHWGPARKAALIAWEKAQAQPCLS